ncbi:MAG: sigma-54-dependent Fis family transcriptional regulator [Firmicutes bacterium]|nr:sigma-54-dependent Fis family transcriptional regulator [Bacillota bacterium]
MQNDQMEILVVDDEKAYCDVIRTLLGVKGHIVDGCYRAKDALAKLDEKDGRYDLLISDLLMPEMDGEELLEKAKAKYPALEVIMLTACSSVERAVACMRKGAYNYVTKGDDPKELLNEVDQIKEKLLGSGQSASGAPGEFMLETNNPAFHSALDIAEKAGEKDVNILITGESGTGKEVFAKYIHSCSGRKDASFVDLNCHTLSATLLESELFGHEKGAFTGADKAREGLFEAADGGTLFLDEIGDVPVEFQAKLLKAIEEKTIYRIGSSKPVSINFRLITATNTNLEEAMKQGTFREDLYYRLSTVIINIPPLRERREDIPLLIPFFLEKAQAETQKEIKRIPTKVKDFLLNYDYPGNVREMKNIIDRMVILSEGGVVQDHYLPGSGNLPEYENGGYESPVFSDTGDSTGHVSYFEDERSLRDFRKQMEKDYISYLLKQYPDDMEKVAQILSISRRQLFNKLVEFGLRDPQ